MTTNAIPNPVFKVNQVETEKRANEGCASITLKQRFGKLLHEVFEGHEEYHGATLD